MCSEQEFKCGMETLELLVVCKHKLCEGKLIELGSGFSFVKDNGGMSDIVLRPNCLFSFGPGKDESNAAHFLVEAGNQIDFLYRVYSKLMCAWTQMRNEFEAQTYRLPNEAYEGYNDIPSRFWGKLVQANLLGEPDGWLFEDKAGCRVSVRVGDTTFLNKVKDGEIQLKGGDVIEGVLMTSLILDSKTSEFSPIVRLGLITNIETTKKELMQ